MKALIIYDNFAFAARVNAMLADAAHRSDEAARWNVKPWRLDLLNLSPAADEALAEAADAHLIVLALHQPESPPAGLMDWLEGWAAHRQVQDAALAVFGGGNVDMLSAPATPRLSRFVERHGLSFIFDAVNPAEDESATFVRELHEREMAVTPTMLQLLEQPDRGDYRHWGLNGGLNE